MFVDRERALRFGFLLLILLLAAALRLWRLDSLPPGLYHDEAYNGLDALSLANGRTFPQFYEGWEQYAAEAHGERPAQENRWPVFFEGNYGREPLHIYMMAATIQLFGAGVFAIRLVPALAGIAAVLTTYLAARALTDRKEEPEEADQDPGPLDRVLLDPALISALALAILFPAIHFSRFGIRAMLFVPLATLTVTFFWRGINKATTSQRGTSFRIHVFANFLLAGLFLGLGLYSFAAARLFPLVFVVFIPYWFWRDRQAMRRHMYHVAAMSGVALLTALPLLLFFARYPYYFVFRIAYVANRGKGAIEGRPWLTWLANVGRVARGLFVLGETHLRHNLPGRPYMDPIQGILFTSGLVVTIRQRHRLEQVFLVIWLLVMLLPSILSGDAPHFGRLTGAAPVVAIFIGLGWVGLVRAIMPRVSASRRYLVLSVSALLLMVSAVWSVVDYFGRYGRHPELPDAFYQADWELGEFLARYPPETTLYLSPSQEELATIYYALGTPSRLTNYTGSEGIVPAGVDGRDAIYVIRSSGSQYLNRLRSVFDDGQSLVGEDGYIAYFIPAEARQLTFENENGQQWMGKLELVGWSQEWRENDLSLEMAWRALSPLNSKYTVFAHLLDENGQIIAQDDRPLAGYATDNWRTGEIVIDTLTLSVPPGIPEQEAILQTGFYDSLSLVNLGEPLVLSRVTIGEVPTKD